MKQLNENPALANAKTMKWLLLIHQIPPKPDALRVKAWRRLQHVGAVAIKQSVYVMPNSEQAREDLSWTLKEIVAGGGDGTIVEAKFLEGRTDEQIIGLFQAARKSDFEKIIQDANSLISEWSHGQGGSQDSAAKGASHVSRLRRRFEELAAINFFDVPERGNAELLIEDLEAQVSRRGSTVTVADATPGNLIGKTWVTRKNLFVDRIGCGWLIMRFVDKAAVFKFVTPKQYVPEPGEIRFDMFEGEFTHEGDLCTFEVLIQHLGLRDPALTLMAQVVHDIDLKDSKYGRGETEGFNALLTGLVSSRQEDDERMKAGIGLFDNLYDYFQRQKDE